MMKKQILEEIINNFSIDAFTRFFRAANDNFRHPNEPLYYEDDNFGQGKKMEEINLEGSNLIVCSFPVKKSLTERTGKKVQYELGKKILKQTQTDAGIFIFYDKDGRFRFSLIYTNYLGKHRDWNNFKRFTYFVSPELTNKTFLTQIGEGDFSSLGKIKEAFSVDPVTKQFYSEIQNWYFWAMDKIKFPEDYKYSTDINKDKEIRNATNLIRLITRIIFIWFLKEKDLVPSDLFLYEKLEKIVRDFMKDKQASNFYSAVLQNLFFATLNQKMNERKFAEDKGYPANKKEYGVKNLYRYADKFIISKEEALKLFKDIPFLNGGLFDCLDKEDETGKVIYVDGFSRNPAKQSIIPDYLFSQQEEERINLSQYGLGAGKPVRGLLEILNSYNFTIDENTPIDQEIALDPELLGKVFENLLASYNPETATTARKSTGSYYTPREIVDYMVEVSLVEYIKGKIPETDEEKIKLLISYSEKNPEFTNEEKQKIITAIDKIKILDPACGSGAFPMGILHKLVLALQRLDPENKYWYELQYQKSLKESEEVFKQGDKNQREERLKEINETFDEGMNYPDYARKLYLIENCIYGVDIQPIAIQISKLRFFISLVLDQKVDREKENFGIRALPNLETRFVSANTLICIDKPNDVFYTAEIQDIEEELKQLRHRYFSAKSRSEKLNYQKKDRELREKLQDALNQIGYTTDSSKKIANFDLYDQNASADWFDPEWMFGVKEGFDIVIANPPYVIYGIGNKLKDNYRKNFKAINYKYSGIKNQFNLAILFIEKSYELLKKEGIFTMIVPHSISRVSGYHYIRDYLDKNADVFHIVDEYGQFEDVTLEMITIFYKKHTPATDFIKCFSKRNQQSYNVPKQICREEKYYILYFDELYLKIKNKGEKILNGYRGYEINSNDCSKESKIMYLDGRNIHKYYINPLTHQRYINKKHYGLQLNKFEIVITQFGTLPRGTIIDTDEMLPSGGTVVVTFDRKSFNIKYILSILNSNLVKYFFYRYIINCAELTIHLDGHYLNRIPIPRISEKEQQPFIDLVDKILAIIKDDDYLTNPEKQNKVKEYERQIDQLVYKLYDLTEEEIKIVEGEIR